MKTRSLPFGEKGTIRLTGKDESFLTGFQAGILAYMKDGQHVQYTDVQLIQFLIRALDDLDNSDGYQAGFVLGWLNSLGEHGVREAETPPSIPAREEPETEHQDRETPEEEGENDAH